MAHEVENRLPYVTCICPTYARVDQRRHLLEETIECFLRQDYPPGRRELLILNDCAGQTLVCAAPGVRVVNESERCPSLGDKYNRLCLLADGDVILPWEDDDIALPERISLSVRKLGGKDYFNPKAYFFSCGETFQYEANTGYAHNAGIFRKSAWKAVGGYPRNNRQDADMDAKLRRLPYALGPLSIAETYFIYRWGVADHLSGNHDVNRAYAERGRVKHPEGVFRLEPHWREDYVARVQALRLRCEAGGKA